MKMWRRCIVLILLLSCSTATMALEPMLLLLLRALRDHAISASIEHGVNALREDAVRPGMFGYALPSAPVAQGTEETRLRAVIDDSFLHLNAAQRDAVFAGMRKIISDPQYVKLKAQIVAEFTLKANSARESYQALARLSRGEKRALAAQAGEEFKRLPPEERRQALSVLEAGLLPVPRDLIAIILTELNAATGGNSQYRSPN